MKSMRLTVLATTLLSAVAIFGTGCNSNVIDKVSFSVAPNLQSVRVALEFTSSIKTDIGGTYAVKNYGYLFAAPNTTDTPFTVGLDLNLEVVNDADYIHYTPTTTLPSGDPLPSLINRALAQIQLEKPVGQKFDVYGFVDILGREWLGTAVIISIPELVNFPTGLAISQSFLKDKQGNPRATAVVFAPRIENGKVIVPGGVAVFANVAALIKGGSTLFLTSKGYDEKVFFNGDLSSGRILYPF